MKRVAAALALTVVSAIVAAFVIASFAPHAAPGLPAKPTGAELQRAIADELAREWIFRAEGELPAGEELPVVELEALLDGPDWSDAVSGCLEQLGLEGVVIVENQFAYFDQTPAGQSGFDQSMGLYACTSRFPEPWRVANILSNEEREFLFHYYANVVAPCVRSAGLAVRPTPRLDDFLSGNTFWSPYEAVFAPDSTPFNELRFENILLRCPDMPEGWYER